MIKPAKTQSELQRFAPVFVAVTVIFAIAATFLLDHCSFLTSNKDTYDEGVRQATIFAVLGGMTFWCYALSVITPPGRIPQTVEWQYIEEAAPSSASTSAVHLIETKKDGRRRACKWCAQFKPDRAHHCRVCKACVLRMDHHCPWIGTCVGFGNHKPFLLLLFYSTITCGFVAYMTGQQYGRRALQAADDFTGSLLGMSLMILSGALGMVLGGFFCFHIYLTTSALTTIEYCEKMRTPDFDRKVYDRGMLGNLKQVLGWNPLLWLLPIGGAEGTGLSFKSKSSKVGPKKSSLRPSSPPETSREQQPLLNN